MTRLATVVAVGAVLAMAAWPVALAEERPRARVIYYGQSRAPGVKASAVTFAQPVIQDVRRSGGGIGAIGPSGRSEDALPAPVAISAHNCIPRTDPRGISLSFEFAEGTAADCLSFVSPAPAPDRGRPNPRRPQRPDPEQLAEAAFDRVISLAPGPDLGVAPARIGLTGLPSYFWVANDLRPIRATAGVRGLTVTAEARPVRYLWDFGDGNDRLTMHPGRPWTKTKRGNVGHVYETKGRYEPSVEVVWAARWRVNEGPWRALGYFSTTGSTDHPVREIVAVLVRRR